MPLTDNLNLPLKQAPYRSRVSDNYTNKNYYLLAFNPGYALQASELNEIQELFYLNQTLSLSYPNNWLTRGYARAGFWEGMVPHDPIKITSTLTNLNAGPNSDFSFRLTIEKGWFLWTDKTSGLSTWIYNPTTYTNSEFVTSFGANSNETEYIGFFIKRNIINCCQTNPCQSDQDETLRDNSIQGNSEFTCSSSRFAIEFYNLNADTSEPSPWIRNDLNSVENVTGRGQFNFYPLLILRKPTTGNNRINFLDNQSIINT